MRAIGVVRVSRTKGDAAVSPSEQRERIEALCKREKLSLVDVYEELDVSGGAALESRPGLSRALMAIESGDVGVIVVAYFDRLVRSIAVQQELVERVEAAGGRVLTADVGEVSGASAGQWLTSSFLGLVAEHTRRVTAERTEEAKRRAVADGVPPFDRVPAGYLRPTGENGRRFARVPLQVDAKVAPVVREAFELRAGGATIQAVREHLRENGVDVSYSATTGMLRSRIYLGELHFGRYVNEHAHTPLVDPDLWRRVQNLQVPRGRKPKSERLLARLGVLRCASCGARMVVGTTRANGKDYPMYRCPPNGDCTRRVTISAQLVEGIVVDEVKQLLRGVVGTASLDTGIAEAQAEAERAEAELDAAVRAFSGLEDVESARERLTALREVRDSARERLDDLRAVVLPAVTVSADDWDDLTISERRDLIRAVVERVVVAPGRGADRVTIDSRL